MLSGVYLQRNWLKKINLHVTNLAYIIQDVVMYQFSDYREALRFYLLQNPARQKTVDLLEGEVSSRQRYEPLDPNNPDCIFAKTVLSIVIAKNNCTREQWSAFFHCEIGTEEDGRMHPQDFADHCGYSKRQVYRWIAHFRKTLIKELARRDLIPEPITEEQKKAELKRFQDARKNYEEWKKEKRTEEEQSQSDRSENGRRSGDRVVYRTQEQ